MTIPFTLRQLEYFDAVASTGSLATGARLCRVSPSALGLAIDELERHLGNQLFIRRKGRGVALTPAGSRLLSQARALLSSAETLSHEARQVVEAVSGRLSVGVYSSLAPFFLPGVIDGFRRRHLDVEIDFVEGEAGALHDHLVQGRIDVALVYQVDELEGHVFDPIRVYRPHVVLPRSHRLARRRAVSLSELIAEPLVLLDAESARQNTEQILGSLGLRPKTVHRASSYEFARCLVGRGLGYSLMFQRPSMSTTYDGHEVVQVDVEDRVEPLVVGLVRPAGSPRTARYRALLGFLTSLTESDAIADPASRRSS